MFPRCVRLPSRQRGQSSWPSRGRWQIVYDAGIGAWTAVNRPTPTALHFLCAHDLASLAVKLDATGDRSIG